MAEYIGIIYKAPIRFNGAIQTFGILGGEIKGRLVQVRRGVGQFGSDQFFIRLPDGALVTAENVAIKPLHEDLPIAPGDAEDVEYTIGGKYPEVGFIIEQPGQPASSSPSFGIAITKAT